MVLSHPTEVWRLAACPAPSSKDVVASCHARAGAGAGPQVGCTLWRLPALDDLGSVPRGQHLPLEKLLDLDGHTEDVKWLVNRNKKNSRKKTMKKEKGTSRRETGTRKGNSAKIS